MLDLILTEMEIVHRFMILTIIPVYWMLVRFLSSALPWGKRNV